MMRPSLRLGCALAAILILAGCGTFQDISDTVGDWFSSSSKSKLKGERLPLNALDDALKPDPALQATPVLLPRPYRNTEWPEPGGYASNAMYHLEASGHLRELWDADAGKGSDTDSRLSASPVVGGGRIFALDSEAHVYAFDAANGQEVWDKRLAPKNGTDMPTLWGLLGKANTIDPVSGMGGGVAYDAGKIFATSGFGVLVAMDAATGKELWRHTFGVPIINAPVVSGGRIFFSTDDNHFYALAENDGRILWDQQGVAESAGILAATSAAVAGEVVIAPYTSGELYALRVQNGQPAWNDVLSHSGVVTALSELDDIAARPVIDRDMVFAISHSGVMAAIALASGERAWTRNVGGTQTPWAAGDYVYVVTSDEQLLCLTRKEGRVRWVHQLPQYANEADKRRPINWSGPVLVSNKLIVVSSSGYAEAISPYTGRMMGRVEIPGGTNIAPIVANDTIYIYTDDALLVALK
ncbi:MAG: PQQ-binding-like beta-propeller repeat protein [Rhizomicrobium sp.]